MENSQQPTPTPFTDVARPGATPANPSSRPIITTNTPEQKDPMMTTAPIVQPPVPSPSPTPTPEPAAPVVAQSTTPVVASTEPMHKLKHDEGHIGHVGKRPMKKRKLIIGILVFFSFAIAFYIIFIRTSS
jgi:hypothetical protein